tara:strand:+ start:468 stop:890 length:423 start_codon:yes stop_codon:yes gene_type:complete
METVHGTTVAVAGAGLLFQGASGRGKSDLALRLIDGGAILIADDRTILSRQGDQVVAQPPEPLRGILEVRGIGLIRVPTLVSIQLRLAVDLDMPPDRLPAPIFSTLSGVDIPLIRLSAFESSAPAKIRLAVGIGPDDIVR